MPASEMRTESGRRPALTIDVHCHLLTLEVERFPLRLSRKTGGSRRPTPNVWTGVSRA